MLTDAHFHADDMASLDPAFPSSYGSLGMVGLASSHSLAGLQRTREIMRGRRCLASFGLHPQLPVMDEADNLTLEASSGRVAAIGECGFDFYGDVPERLRSPANESAQAAVFEFQLSLAERYGLPLVLHLRRANDMLFRYAGRLSRLKAVALHAWGGPANEALDFLKRCPRALFSFGTGALNGSKKARASISALPASAMLAETDAPYQPPRSSPLGGMAGNTGGRWPLTRAYSTPSDIALVIDCIAGIRGESPMTAESYIEKNFTEAFGHAL